MRYSLGAASLALAAAIVGQPSANSVTLAQGGDLQQALDSARSGDTILLARGATFTGNFVLPVHPGNADAVVTIRTEGDADLPRAGERITPAASDRLAKLRSPNGSPALQTAPGARGWRIELVEFMPNRDGVGDIVALGDGSAKQKTIAQVPSGLTLDRVYLHGDPQAGQKRAIALNSAATTITGCYIADIKAIGQDSQAIAGWNGPGGYVIENNYLEAAGENLMIGGADPSILELTPTQIVIRGNTLTKSLSWHEKGAPKWQVKNLFELKNARSVLVEHSVMEHSWQQAQSGYAVLFTVRNQDGGCPWCQVEDVRFEHNVVREVAAGLQVLGSDPVHPSRQTNHISITDNLFDGIDREAWGGDGYFMLLSDSPREVTVDHNTIVQRASTGLVKIANGLTTSLAITNNIAGHGNFGIIGKDHGVGNDSIATFLPGAVIAKNVIAGGKASLYPPGNLFPSLDDFRAQFVDFSAHDYHLKPRSPWQHAGTDGRDLGADLAPITALLERARPPRVSPPRRPGSH
jgi:hypothetical protein